MGSKNRKLLTAKINKNDEFYTRYCDIENELQYYTDQFEDKIVYCNCDDPNKSNFYKYFKDNFDKFKMRKLYATSYNPDGQGTIGIYDGKEEIISSMKYDGDYRCIESINLLAESDIIVTNPPFSLFRDYISLLMEYHKKFIIIGNINSATHKEVFPYIKDGIITIGKNFLKSFIDYSTGETRQVCCAYWYTNTGVMNMKHYVISKNFADGQYPKYDNYDAINVDKRSDIPVDYDGPMGVPIGILESMYPDGYIHLFSEDDDDLEYSILKYRKGDDEKDLHTGNKYYYPRVLIQKIDE